MLLGVGALEKQLLTFSTNPSSFKEVEETDANLNFQSALKEIIDKKSITEDSHRGTSKNSDDTGVYKEADKNDEVLDKMSYLVELILKIKLNYEELDNTDFNNILIKLEESLQVFENTHKSNELIHFSIEEMESLMDIVMQAKEILNNEESLREYPLALEIDNALEQMEDIFTDALDLADNSKGDAEKGKLLNVEDLNIQENYYTTSDHMDHGFEYKDLSLEGVDKVENKEHMESNIDLTDENLMEDGEAQSAKTESNYSFSLFNKETAATNNLTEVNLIENYEREELIQQIIEKVEFKEGIERQEIKIRLKPDYLGELILKVEVKEGLIQGKLVVDNNRTKEIIESGIYQLKEQFEEKGLDIKAFEVFVGTNEDFEREKRNGHAFRKNPTKLKLGTKSEEEVRIYNSNMVKHRNETYYEGRLNLFV